MQVHLGLSQIPYYELDNPNVERVIDDYLLAYDSIEPYPMYLRLDFAASLSREENIEIIDDPEIYSSLSGEEKVIFSVNTYWSTGSFILDPPTFLVNYKESVLFVHDGLSESFKHTHRQRYLVKKFQELAIITKYSYPGWLLLEKDGKYYVIKYDDSIMPQHYYTDSLEIPFAR